MGIYLLGLQHYGVVTFLVNVLDPRSIRMGMFPISFLVDLKALYNLKNDKETE